MLKALISTITELLDSKKAAYSFIAALGASVLHLYFKVSVQESLLLVSPLGVATLSQAHVDAAAAKSGKSAAAVTAPVAATVTTTAEPAPAEAGTSESADAAKTDG